MMKGSPGIICMALVSAIAPWTGLAAQRPGLEVAAGIVVQGESTRGLGPHFRVGITSRSKDVRPAAHIGASWTTGDGDPPSCEEVPFPRCTGRRDRLRLFEAAVSAQIPVARNERASLRLILPEVSVQTGTVESTEWALPPPPCSVDFCEPEAVQHRSRGLGVGLGAGSRIALESRALGYFLDFRLSRVFVADISFYRFVAAAGVTF